MPNQELQTIINSSPNVFDLEDLSYTPKSFFIGQKFKNYRALCEFLETPILAGLSKENHMANLQTYFTFSRKGQSLTISEIHKDPSNILPPERKPRSSFWEENLSLMILSQLEETLDSSCGAHTINRLIISTNSAMIEYGFCNSEIENITSLNIEDFDQTPKLKKGSFKEMVAQSSPITTSSSLSLHNDLFSSLNNKLWKDTNQVLTRSLTALKKKRIILYSYDFVLKSSKNAPIRPATPDENLLINSITVNLLKEQGFSSLEEVFLNHKDKSFFLKRNQLLKDKSLHSCFKAHIVAFTPASIDFAQTYKASLEEFLSAKLKINARSYDNLVAFYRKRTSCLRTTKVILAVLDRLVKLES